MTATGWCLTGHHKKTDEAPGCYVVSPISGRQCSCDCHTEEEIETARAVWIERTGGVDMTWGQETKKKPRGRKKSAEAPASDDTETAEQEDPAGQIEDEERDALEGEGDAERGEGPGEGVPEGSDVDAGAREEVRDLA